MGSLVERGKTVGVLVVKKRCGSKKTRKYAQRRNNQDTIHHTKTEEKKG